MLIMIVTLPLVIVLYFVDFLTFQTVNLDFAGSFLYVFFVIVLMETFTFDSGHHLRPPSYS